jgi:hypothetical protein
MSVNGRIDARKDNAHNLDPAISRDQEGVDSMVNLIRTHFKLGGTQINMNGLDYAKIISGS